MAGNGGAVAGLPCSSRSCSEERFRGECALEGSSKVLGGGDVGASSRSFSSTEDSGEGSSKEVGGGNVSVSSRLFSFIEDSGEDTVVSLEGNEVSEISLGATSVDMVESVGL